ncbi:MAG: hypothetical protein QHJ82_16690 [Verrucomicrobiota bacterium]|nr:hypothetical protein [Verrucomicrobiota bacterium]
MARSTWLECGWLAGILKQKILDHFQRLARERTLSEDESLPEELQNRFDDVGL